ncbi:MAG: SprT-like domain-containing protein [Bacteroidota bacterium]
MPALASAAHAETFKKHFPPEAADFCFKLWQQHGFYFSIKHPRKSVLGDYRYRNGIHTITLNADLNQYAFLVTYLHEVAHYLVKTNYKLRKQPHGKEWKAWFKRVMLPVLRPDVFPPEILEALTRYMENPAASSCADPSLLKALEVRQKTDLHVWLDELPDGKAFKFEGRIYRRLNKRRTRITCRLLVPNTAAGKVFLISGAVPVEPIDEKLYNLPAEPSKPELPSGMKKLKFLPDNSPFKFQGRSFIKLALQRTRVLCAESGSKKQFLISGDAAVSPI